MCDGFRTKQRGGLWVDQEGKKRKCVCNCTFFFLAPVSVRVVRLVFHGLCPPSATVAMPETEEKVVAEAPSMPEGDAADKDKHPARIQVSLGKKPLFFYVNLAKKLMQQHGEVQLSALGFAMSNMVSVAEILKKDKLAVEKKLTTSIDTLSDQGRPRPVRKPKMEIVLVKSEQFDAIMAEEKANAEKAAAEEKANADKTTEDDGVTKKSADS